MTPSHPRLEARPRSLELFTGAGGLALGTHLAGFEHLALVEWNKDACRTLEANARARAVPGIDRWQVISTDARLLAFEAFGTTDLVAGGPPCQPFSIGGKHRGMEDSRDMIPQFIRAIRALRPRAFILENVKGLLRSSFQTYFGYVLLQLTYPTVERRPDEGWLEHLRRLEAVHTPGNFPDLHYNVVSELLNAADYGVPQTRERVFIVGFRADLGVEWHFPEATHGRDMLMHQQWMTGDYWEQRGLSRPGETPGWARSSLQRTRELDLLEPRLRPWQTVFDAFGGLPEPREDGEVEGVLNHRLVPGARSYVGHTGSPLHLPAKTLKAGDHGVPGGENTVVYPDGSLRYFTVREAARLQTMPDKWRFEGSWTETMRQLGNAVPVDLARVVARSVAEALPAQRGDGKNQT